MQAVNMHLIMKRKSYNLLFIVIAEEDMHWFRLLVPVCWTSPKSCSGCSNNRIMPAPPLWFIRSSTRSPYRFVTGSVTEHNNMHHPKEGGKNARGGVCTLVRFLENIIFVFEFEKSSSFFRTHMLSKKFTIWISWLATNKWLRSGS